MFNKKRKCLYIKIDPDFKLRDLDIDGNILDTNNNEENLQYTIIKKPIIFSLADTKGYKFDGWYLNEDFSFIKVNIQSDPHRLFTYMVYIYNLEDNTYKKIYVNESDYSKIQNVLYKPFGKTRKHE